MKSEEQASREVSRSSRGRRLGVLVAVVFATATLYLFKDRVSLETLAERESELLAFRDRQPLAATACAFLTYVAMAGLSIPGAVGLSLAIGWYFGFWHGFVLVSFASTCGATVAFLVSRYLFRDFVNRRYTDRVRAFNEAFERDGVVHLLTLRLIPLVPFFVINLAMGLTPLRVHTFWWGSQLGMLPGTAAYLFAGSSIGSLGDLADRGVAGVITSQLFVAMLILGLLPIAAKLFVNHVLKRGGNLQAETPSG